jgi:hypothetical protein
MVSGFKRRLNALVGKEVATQLLTTSAVEPTYMADKERARIPRSVRREAD